MRARDAVIALVAAAAACAGNPDPRARSLEIVQRDGHGGWIEVTDRTGRQVAGELIAVELVGVYVLAVVPRSELVFVPKAAIESAKLWAWRANPYLPLGWAGLGTLSTISHGFILVLSAPVWMITGGLASLSEAYAPLFEYPTQSWDRISIWARFPQGLPVGLRGGDLLQQDRTPRDAGVDATTVDAANVSEGP